MQVTQTLNLFSPDECQEIIEMGEALPQVNWEYDGAHQGTVDLKKTGSAISVSGKKTKWIIDKFLPLVKAWPVVSIEPLQFGVYEVGGFMDWHLDKGQVGGGYWDGENYMTTRLCAGILLLTNPGDYEGGILQIKTEAEFPVNAHRTQGSLVVLGSEVLHRVTEVTSGIRKTLVIWGLSEAPKIEQKPIENAWEPQAGD
jgi:PKHD-type hydroxylase